jgi:hypothetical protein
MYAIDDQYYSPCVCSKKGELGALSTLDVASKDRSLPNFVALPLDKKKEANISETELLRREVGKVTSSWGNRVCLWDPRFLVLDDVDPSNDARRLGTLLQSFVRFGAKVIPVANLHDRYERTATIGKHARDSGSGAALRIRFDDIQSFDLIESQINTMGIRPSECVLVIDLFEADLTQHDEFGRSLVSWLNDLHSRWDWKKLITVLGGYPEGKNPALPNSQFSAPREGWQAWKWMIENTPAITNFAIFGDFGADHGNFSFGGGGKPITHLRYATEDVWMIVRGGEGYASIRGVSERIRRSSTFMGRHFSAGDEFISDCARGIGGAGDPSAWRAANMNHHMTANVRRLGALYGFVLDERVPDMPDQVSLFADG